MNDTLRLVIVVVAMGLVSTLAIVAILHDISTRLDRILRRLGEDDVRPDDPQPPTP